MEKNGKRFVKPGFLLTHKKAAIRKKVTSEKLPYEVEREEMILENTSRMHALGIPGRADALYGQKQTTKQKSNMKGNRLVDDDDDDYPPFEDEEVCSYNNEDDDRMSQVNKLSYMKKNGKRFVKPGFLLTHKKAAIRKKVTCEKLPYEVEREKMILENAARMHALGIPGRADALYGQKQTTKRKNNMKGNRLVDDDDDYALSEGEEEVGSYNDEDDDRMSQVNKVTLVPSRTTKRVSLRPRPQHINDPMQLETHDQQPNPTHGPHAQAEPDQLSPHTATCRVAPTSISRIGKRGPNRGKNVDKIRKVLGKPIPVDINYEEGTINGQWASSVAFSLGEQIRDTAPIREFAWEDIEFEIKLAIVLRVGYTFDFGGDYEKDSSLRTVLDIKCHELYKDWKSVLHRHYISLKMSGKPNIKSCPLLPCKEHDWKYMIENVWETDAFKKKSESGKRARASHKYNHTGGSRSYASRSSMEAAKNGGVRPSMADIFEITHKRHRHGGVWINELAEQDHALLKEKIDAQSQPNTENPQTEVQISVEVLGKRSSFSRGFGKIKTTSSSRQSQATSHELAALQKKFADQQQKLDDQQQKLDDQDNTLMEWRGLLQMMAAKFGMDPSTVPGLVVHNGGEDHTSSGGHDAPSLG